MTRVSRDFSNTMQKEAVPAVSADVTFTSSRFPNYKLGPYNQIMEAKEDPKVLSMKEVVARETAQLLEQQKRLSVRDLANKFEKGLAAAAKLSDEVRFFCVPPLVLVCFYLHWLLKKFGFVYPTLCLVAKKNNRKKGCEIQKFSARSLGQRKLHFTKPNNYTNLM